MQLNDFASLFFFLEYFLNLLGMCRVIVFPASQRNNFSFGDQASSSAAFFFLFSENKMCYCFSDGGLLNVEELPRVIVTTPVHLVSVRTVAVVQVIVIHEAFSWPRACDKC